MRKLILITLATILILTGISSAGEITLKKSFWSGWKYSTDGQSYTKVGMSGKSLRMEMEGDELAQAEVDIYKKRQTLVAITGWPGGLILGWTLGEGIFGEWDSTNETLLAISIPLCLISTIAEVSGNKHLKKAVSIYNGEEQALMFDVDLKKSKFTDNTRISFGLALSF